MEQIESITEYLKRRLREAGAARFDGIAAAATQLAGLSEEEGVKTSFIRKFVYGSRENPRVQTIQPLLDYFAAVDRGELQLPPVRELA
jgi:type II secretory pathway component PulJ